jgi:hypothetical protein
MDELLYLIALVVGIFGAIAIWKYGKTKQWAVTRAIRRQRREKERE